MGVGNIGRCLNDICAAVHERTDGLVRDVHNLLIDREPVEPRTVGDRQIVDQLFECSRLIRSIIWQYERVGSVRAGDGV